MVPVVLMSLPWRAVAAALVAIALASLPTYALALFLLPPVPLPVMVRSFVVGSALPAAIAWGILRAFRGTASVESGVLRLARADLVVEVPVEALTGTRAWWVPLPGPGLTLMRRSGKPLPLHLVLRDPAALLRILGAAGVGVAGMLRHPSVVYAATRPSRRWWSPIVKFPIAGALPAGVLFYTHQHIAYGGTLGQYYLEGLGPYLATFAQYWATTVILLISYASFWRAAVEILVFATGAVAAEPAPAARRVAEVVCALAYYAGVPTLLALRYMD